MFDIISKRFRFFTISAVLILICIISLSSLGLKAGIEFSGGSQLTISFKEDVELIELKQELDNLGYGNAIIQQVLGSGDFLVRTFEISDSEEAELVNELAVIFGPLDSRSDDISPITARETTNITTIAIAIAAVGIMLYVTWAFRRMPKPFRYGTCAIIALLHDTLIALGVFSILSGILDWEVNLMFITGILAVIGYSVNNTVVIFDRIRDNLSRSEDNNFGAVVNTSLTESLTRSINTSLTTIIVVLALLLFVGSTIQNFAVVLMIGIIAGTFSSLFIAPLLLVVWENREWLRFFRWLPLLKTNNRK
ncbi:MAG: protein translocase subunit SecF [Dehalococcoidia bacterium]|nr:MAG: protein translocase subunit SecF [Dehalococcoidia bacterium]